MNENVNIERNHRIIEYTLELEEEQELHYKLAGVAFYDYWLIEEEYNGKNIRAWLLAWLLIDWKIFPMVYGIRMVALKILNWW